MNNADRLIVVGLTGPAGSGKDTVARILCALAGFERVALADPMKMALVSLGGAAMDPFKELDAIASSDPDRIIDALNCGVAYSLRNGLQLLGTEARDAAGSPTQWVDVALSVIYYFNANHPKARTRFVVPDVRYPHEADRLREVVAEHGGIYETWRIKPLDDHKPILSAHSSENPPDKVRADKIIGNVRQGQGMRTELAGRVCMAFDRILNPNVEVAAQ